MVAAEKHAKVSLFDGVTRTALWRSLQHSYGGSGEARLRIAFATEPSHAGIALRLRLAQSPDQSVFAGFVRTQRLRSRGWCTMRAVPFGDRSAGSWSRKSSRSTDCRSA